MGKDLALPSSSSIRKSRDGEGYQEGSKSSAFDRCKPHCPPPFCALGRQQGKISIKTGILKRKDITVSLEFSCGRGLNEGQAKPLHQKRWKN